MRYRFEKASQVFDTRPGDVVILPINEAKPGSWVELPALIYPADEEKIKEKLKALQATDVVCENLGAIQIANELGLTAHGGMFLNVINSEAIEEYKELGLVDVTMSFEIPFKELRGMKSRLPFGIVIYGYLPLMKFRSCPNDCKKCTGLSTITDRLGEEFTLICRNKKYSELLNCVPLYTADKPMPNCDFQTLYFTKESKEEAEEIRDMVITKAEYKGRKTGGLYHRELL